MQDTKQAVDCAVATNNDDEDDDDDDDDGLDGNGAEYRATTRLVTNAQGQVHNNDLEGKYSRKSRNQNMSGEEQSDPKSKGGVMPKSSVIARPVGRPKGQSFVRPSTDNGRTRAQPPPDPRPCSPRRSQRERGRRASHILSLTHEEISFVLFRRPRRGEPERGTRKLRKVARPAMRRRRRRQ